MGIILYKFNENRRIEYLDINTAKTKQTFSNIFFSWKQTLHFCFENLINSYLFSLCKFLLFKFLLNNKLFFRENANE